MENIVKSGFLKEVFMIDQNILVDYDFRNPAQGTNFEEITVGGATTNLFYNLQNSTGSQYSGSNIYNTGFPAIAYADSSSVYLDVVSGEFDGNTKFRILGEPTGDDWTFYAAFKHLQTAEYGKSKVILSSKDTDSTTSGFSLGINGCNRLFFEYNINQTEKRIFTLDRELDNRNLASLSKVNSVVYLGLHQYGDLNNFSFEAQFPISGFTLSNKYYLGGMGTASSDYLNFSGYIDQFMILNQGMEFPERNTFSEAFFSSGYVDDVVSVSSGTFARVTGTRYEDVLIGTGITGYEQYLKGYEVIDGESFPIYSYSGVTGEVYENKIVELTGTVSGSFENYVLSNRSGIPNYPYIMNFANSKILSLNNFDDSSKEVYSFSGVNTNDLNLTSAFVSGTGQFSLLKKESSETVNLYANGVLEPLVSLTSSAYSGAFVVSNNYVFSNGFFDRDDMVYYDIIQGSQASVTVDASDETAGYKDLSYATVDNRDIYFNGKKLISGVDFTDTGSDIRVQPDGWFVQGELVFAPKHDSNLTRFTGFTDNNFDTSIPLFDEQVWINGLRQIKYADYEKVSDFSLKYTTFSLEPLKDTIYNNDTGYFNV